MEASAAANQHLQKQRQTELLNGTNVNNWTDCTPETGAHIVCHAASHLRVVHAVAQAAQAAQHQRGVAPKHACAVKG